MIKKYLIDKDLVNKIEKIDFWNEKNYFLTSNYLIIVQHKSVYAIKYSDISKIYVETILNINRPGSYEEYLHIFSSNNEFKILTFSTKLVGEELMNIKDYLLNKNDKIIVEENKKG